MVTGKSQAGIEPVQLPPTSPDPVASNSPPSRRDLASWWRQFKRNTRKEELKGMSHVARILPTHCAQSRGFSVLRVSVYFLSASRRLPTCPLNLHDIHSVRDTQWDIPRGHTLSMRRMRPPSLWIPGHAHFLCFSVFLREQDMLIHFLAQNPRAVSSASHSMSASNMPMWPSLSPMNMARASFMDTCR